MKQMLLALIIAFCINGVHWNDYFISTSVILFCLMNGGWLLSWKIYHKHFSYYDVLILGALIISAFLIEWNLHISLSAFAIWTVLLVLDWCYVNIDIEKYTDEMIFNEKLLTAQNFNNIVLLNQYAKEKKLRYFPKKNYPSKLLKRAPIIWKAKTSILRLSIELIIVSFVIFVVCLLIYKMPFFWSFMFLDQEAVRKMLLSASIFAIFQISLQSMLKQLDSLIEKRQDGLFIPISNASIVKQFTMIPILVIAIESVLLSVIVQQKIYLIVICGSVMIVLTVVIFILNIRYKEALNKFYYIFSIAILMISFIMT